MMMIGGGKVSEQPDKELSRAHVELECFRVIAGEFGLGGSLCLVLCVFELGVPIGLCDGSAHVTAQIATRADV